MLLEMSNHLNSEGQGFGKTYEHGAFIDDGTPVPPHDPRAYWPATRPGMRLPHMWIDPEHTTSTIDWLDGTFVLVCGPDADSWRAAAADAGAISPVPLTVRTLPNMGGAFTFGADGAVLVRPDGVVAWRPESRGSATELVHAVQRILAGGTLSRSEHVTQHPEPVRS
jgi:tetracenomycin A2 monooxygenase-dioxygenase